MKAGGSMSDRSTPQKTKRELGKRVNEIRTSEQYVKDEPERRAELDVMGFRWYK